MDFKLLTEVLSFSYLSPVHMSWNDLLLILSTYSPTLQQRKTSPFHAIEALTKGALQYLSTI